MNREQLEGMTVKDLKPIAKEKGVYVTDMRKDVMIDAILGTDKSTDNEEPPAKKESPIVDSSGFVKDDIVSFTPWGNTDVISGTYISTVKGTDGKDYAKIKCSDKVRLKQLGGVKLKAHQTKID